MTALEAAVMPAASKPRRGKSKAAGDQVAAPSAPGSVPPAVQLIPLALLDDNPANPRGKVAVDAEFVDSLRAVGLLEPLIVAPAPLFWPAARDGEPLEDGADRFVIIAGHRRKVGCELAPIDPVQCIVRGDLVGGRDEDAMLIENLHREDLTPIEEARGYQRLLDRGLSQRDVAQRVGRTQPHISKTVALLKLPQLVHDQVTDGTVTLDDARALIPIADDVRRIQKVLARPSWQPVAGAVQEQVVEINRSKQVAALIGQLKREGKTYIKTVPWDGYLHALPERAREGHEKLPCHAFTIPNSGPARVAAVCSAPGSHREVDTQKAAAAADRAKREKEEAARRQQREQRLAIVQRALGGSKPSRQLEEYAVARAVAVEIENTWGEAAKTVIALLGLSAAEDQDVEEILSAFAAKGHTHRLRLLAAFHLDTAENAWSHVQDDGREPYLQLLEQHGWVPPKVLR